MCGICAGISKENMIDEIVGGLKKLEYRGYDSSGVAYIENGKIKVVKSVGQIKNLEKKLAKTCANIVIGHTRWATHGVVSESNSHPHISQDGKVAIVHNGIIENYEKLKTTLKTKEFYSQTDTEVLANVISQMPGDNLQKIVSACREVVGSFALAVMFENCKDIFLAKRNSPLAVAIGDGEVLASSDISVFAEKFEFCYILDDDEFARINSKNVVFFDKNGKKIEKNRVFLKNFDFYSDFSDEKYFMLKEVKEQPMAIRKTFFEYTSDKKFFDLQQLKAFKSFHFIACGTAYHSCLMGARYIRHFCKKETHVSLASEFKYDENVLSKKCLYIFVSQSGETADTIACAKMIKEKGLMSMGITNVSYCTLNNLVDFVLPTFAGREVAVASTKAYTCQLFTMLLFALMLAGKDLETLKSFVLDFNVCDLGSDILQSLFKFKKIFFVGREQDYVTSLEGALKLKEIAYLNCLGIAGGELKHGTLALVDDETLVIAISTQTGLKEKMENVIEEIRARGGKVLLVSQFEHNTKVDYKIVLPVHEECLMPIVSVVPLQLLALEFCVRLGFNPDKPRNLAKSVTVE